MGEESRERGESEVSPMAKLWRRIDEGVEQGGVKFLLAQK